MFTAHNKMKIPTVYMKKPKEKERPTKKCFFYTPFVSCCYYCKVIWQLGYALVAILMWRGGCCTEVKMCVNKVNIQPVNQGTTGIFHFLRDKVEDIVC